MRDAQRLENDAEQQKCHGTGWAELNDWDKHIKQRRRRRGLSSRVRRRLWQDLGPEWYMQVDERHIERLARVWARGPYGPGFQQRKERQQRRRAEENRRAEEYRRDEYRRRAELDALCKLNTARLRKLDRGVAQGTVGEWCRQRGVRSDDAVVLGDGEVLSWDLPLRAIGDRGCDILPRQKGGGPRKKGSALGGEGAPKKQRTAPKVDMRAYFGKAPEPSKTEPERQEDEAEGERIGWVEVIWAGVVEDMVAGFRSRYERCREGPEAFAVSADAPRPQWKTVPSVPGFRQERCRDRAGGPQVRATAAQKEQQVEAYTKYRAWAEVCGVTEDALQRKLETSKRREGHEAQRAAGVAQWLCTYQPTVKDYVTAQCQTEGVKLATVAAVRAGCEELRAESWWADRIEEAERRLEGVEDAVAGWLNVASEKDFAEALSGWLTEVGEELSKEWEWGKTATGDEETSSKQGERGTEVGSGAQGEAGAAEAGGVYHEVQVAAWCGKHALNNLLGGPYVTEQSCRDAVRNVVRNLSMQDDHQEDEREHLHPDSGWLSIDVMNMLGAAHLGIHTDEDAVQWQVLQEEDGARAVVNWNKQHWTALWQQPGGSWVHANSIGGAEQYHGRRANLTVAGVTSLLDGIERAEGGVALHRVVNSQGGGAQYLERAGRAAVIGEEDKEEEGEQERDQAPPGGQAGLGQRVRVVSLNVDGLGHYQHGAQQRMRQMLGSIRAESPDAILLQEVTEPMHAVLHAELPDWKVYRYTKRKR